MQTITQNQFVEMLSQRKGANIIGLITETEPKARKTGNPFKEIKKLGLFTETLILTGHGSIDTALEAIKLGAYDYLTKPCEIDDLMGKIEGAWQKKDGAEKKEMKEKMQKVVESPSSIFDLFRKKK